MHANLAHSLDLILASEGGYADVPGDTGGPTNMGVTLTAFRAWTSRPEATPDDLRGMPRQVAREVFASEYATPVCFDELPSGLDYAVLDASVNSGPSRAARLLQESLGMPAAQVDGIIGAKTLAAVAAAASPSALVPAYCDARLAFMQQLTSWGQFGKGWSRRVVEVRRDALAIAVGTAGSAAAAVVPLKTQAPAKATGGVRLLSTLSGKAALAAVLAALVAAAGVAAQASSLLAPYADMPYVRAVLPMLSLLAAAAPLVVAVQRAVGGATS